MATLRVAARGLLTLLSPSTGAPSHSQGGQVPNGVAELCLLRASDRNHTA
ncbi:hypothetical protein SAMN05421505_10971 [Sinosporangium album]|uniref:Uncharacterized protein n=1 Tax=Sinosporangium album TaxID=504805 RepID=A0A1G7Y247_9ACTN|nr:hypothetical protein SAMN05421505_10971 [Sinosporangium album]